MRPALRYNVVTAAIPVGYFAIVTVGMAFQSLTLIVAGFAFVLACVAYQRSLKCAKCGWRLSGKLVEPFVYSTYVKPKPCPQCGEPLR